jgi:four helix bundle protein
MEDRDARLNALEARTKKFAVDVLAFVVETPIPAPMRTVMYQLSDAATSVSGNHRAVRRSRSTKEFAAKLQVVNEEADEALHWLEVIDATGYVKSPLLQPLLKEARELRSLFAKARSTLRRRRDE